LTSEKPKVSLSALPRVPRSGSPTVLLTVLLKETRLVLPMVPQKAKLSAMQLGWPMVLQ